MGSTIRALVVDGDPDRAARTARILDGDGALESVVETTAAAGLARLDEVDCVVGEYGVPGAAGLDLLAAVRRDRPDLPFVVFTGDGSEAVASRAIAAGATDYLPRGGDGELAERVRRAVDRRNGREAERGEARRRRAAGGDCFARYVVRDGVVEYANARLAELLGAERSELVGREVREFVAEGDRDHVRRYLRGRIDGDDEVRYGCRLRRADGTPVAVEVHGERVDDGGEPAVAGAIVEVGDRERRIRSLGALNRGTQRLMRAEGREAVCGIAVETAEEALDLDVSGVYRRSGDRLEPAAASERGIELLGDPPALPLDDSIAGAVYRSGESRLVDDFGADSDAYNPDTEVRNGLYLPLGDHGVIVAGSSTAADLDEGDRSLATVLAAAVEAALDRTARERRLNELHAATRRLTTARSRREVAEIAVDAARDVLGHELNGIHLVADDGATLPPAAVSERTRETLGEVPALSVEGSAAGEALRSGETRIYPDVRTAGVAANPETSMRRELVVPLGEEGVFIAGGTEAGAFEESIVSLTKVFAANVEAALVRASREAAVREREDELRRQNDRLEEFAGVVSHDLRNPLEVARGYTDLARDAHDSEELAAVARAHDRLAARIDELLTLARRGTPVGEIEPVAVGEVARQLWERFGEATADDGDRTAVEEAALVVDDDAPTVDADPERLRLLVENLLANAVQHGGAGVAIRVGPLDGGGFYVADDGPGLPPEAREAVFEYGHTDADDGNGFGLAVVRVVADAHGWAVRVAESESGGARFEVEV